MVSVLIQDPRFWFSFIVSFCLTLGIIKMFTSIK